MKILVKARPRSREEKVEQQTQPSLGFSAAKPEILVYKVSVKEPPEGGKANEAIARLLAKHFKIPLLAVRLVSGQTSRQKIFEIDK